MMDKSTVRELIALTEKNVICTEAIDLLERCLAERSPRQFEEFMQRHMLENPASFDVLQDLAEQVHQHMIALQQSLFDVRSSMLNSLHEQFNIDLAQLIPLESIEEYNRLELDEALAFVVSRYPQLGDHDLVAVCHTLHNAVARAGQITQSLVLVREILDYVFDWSEALSIFVVKSYWQWQAGYPHSRPNLIQ